jgi:hypothetical protein
MKRLQFAEEPFQFISSKIRSERSYEEANGQTNLTAKPIAIPINTGV